MAMTPTMRWARAHNYQTHPALQQAIDDAKPLIERGEWALVVAQAFDAGVAARALLEGGPR